MTQGFAGKFCVHDILSALRKGKWNNMGEIIEKLRQNLQRKGYEVNVFQNAEEAAKFINEQIDGKTVGIGGSATIHQMKLFSMLNAHNTVYWHDEKPEDLSVMETRRRASSSEVYLSSVNAVSEDGEIVNIDNTGNRVAAISFGPSDVYLLIGKNKVCPDLDSAIVRARNVAAPQNARRLNRKTPCAIHADHCYDCKSPERICRSLSILLYPPTGAKYHVILIDEELGY
jgi:L-lactate utilization protein LutB